ncbi:MAG: aldo/keto reductase [Elusimicrobia bacterium]|nr:aldo/keto reductase [Elusimicrobiota bacterium]
MRRRPLGRSGLSVSEIGFGGWGIGKSMWGRTEDEDSLKALRAAIEHGIDYFDTAAVYGHGHSERLIARVLRETGAKASVGTKVPPQNMEWPAHERTRLAHAFPPDWVRASAERSLRNLRRDSIDVLMFHVWNDRWLADPLWPETLGVFTRLREEGKVRLVGLSVNSDDPDSALGAVQAGVADAVQVIFNLFDQRAAERLFPACREKGVGIIVRCPFDEGGLTGTLTPQTRFTPEDFRSYYFGGDRLAETCRRADALKGLLVPNHGETLTEAALRWCLSAPEVATVIPGMRAASHVSANVRAADGAALEPALLETLKAHAWTRNFYR